MNLDKSIALWKARHTYRTRKVNLWQRRNVYRTEHLARAQANLTKAKAAHSRSEVEKWSARVTKYLGLQREAEKEIAHWGHLQARASRMLSRRRKQRDAQAADQVSDKGVQFIAAFEGFEPTPKPDPVGFCTVGFGHLIRRGPCTAADMRHYGTMTRLQGYKLLDRELDRFERAVRAARPGLKQQEFDGFVSFIFNNGEGAISPQTRVGRALRAGRIREAADAMLAWDHAGGRRLPGLTRRRREERDMILNGDYNQ